MYRIDMLNFGWASFEAPKGPGSATIKIRPSSFASVNIVVHRGFATGG
jgi:hypothetical protein